MCLTPHQFQANVMKKGIDSGLDHKEAAYAIGLNANYYPDQVIMAALFLDFYAKDKSFEAEKKLTSLLSADTVLPQAQKYWTSDPEIIRSKYEIGSSIMKSMIDDSTDPKMSIDNLPEDVSILASMLINKIEIDDYLKISQHFAQGLHYDYDSTLNLCQS